jgi:hypothetical protein
MFFCESRNPERQWKFPMITAGSSRLYRVNVPIISSHGGAAPLGFRQPLAFWPWTPCPWPERTWWHSDMVTCHGKILWCNIEVYYKSISLGKWEYFTHLNSSAIWGWFPLLTMIPGRGRSEVVIIYPDICFLVGITWYYICIYHYLSIIE